ncbi:MAG: 3'(2'),5'-bisphosphate nucleotidase CysQ [Pseudorhodoplanes sp.]
MENGEIPTDLTRPALLDDLAAIASRAAAAIMDRRRAGISVRGKADASPVTDADMASEAIILEGLARVLPGILVVSEEAEVLKQTRLVPDTFILVDPLDGTREFVAGRDEFTVNIAVVHRERPVAGIVSAPALDTLWRGASGVGAERLQLSCGAHPKDAATRSVLRTAAHRGGTRPGPWRAMVSRSHPDPATEHWLRQLPDIECIDCGSSLKFCRIAEGLADVYPRLSPTSEWDIAAGDAVLSAAGGAVLTLEGELLRYGQVVRKLKVPSFIAWSDATDAARVSGAP